MALLTGLAAGLLRDAAAVVPGSAGLAPAVATHRLLRGSPAEDLAGPLLVAASQARELRELLQPDDDLSVVLVGNGGLDAVRSARDALQDDAWVRVAGVELPIPDTEDPAAAARAVLDDLSFTVPAALVVSTGPRMGDVLDELAADGAELASLRYGATGTESADQVADFLLGCTARSLAFTLGGDQRSAVRDVDPRSREQLPGHLNALAATWAALDGADHEAVAALLDSQDPDILVSVLTAADVPRLRTLLVAATSSDVAASAHDLRRLGLLDDEL
jgi:hypothetical protein